MMAAKYRLSPSLIDAVEFYRFRTGDWGEDKQAASRDDLIAQIKREPREPSEAMCLGTAFHAAVEAPPPRSLVDRYPRQVYEVSDRGHDFAFDAGDVDELAAQMPQRVFREVPGRLTVGDAVCRVKADAIHGLTGHELKTTTKQLNDKIEQYSNTIQWRIYLEAFGLDEIVYHLVKLGKDRKSGVYTVVEHLPFRQYRYTMMADDIRRRVDDCVAFIDSMGLLEHIRETT